MPLRGTFTPVYFDNGDVYSREAITAAMSAAAGRCGDGRKRPHIDAVRRGRIFYRLALRNFRMPRPALQKPSRRRSIP